MSMQALTAVILAGTSPPLVDAPVSAVATAPVVAGQVASTPAPSSAPPPAAAPPPASPVTLPPASPPPASPPPSSPAPAPRPEAGAPGDIVVTARGAVAGDPLQQVNAQSYAVAQSIDKAVVGPVALAYRSVIPLPARDGLRNFLNNLKEPIVALNYLLQFKPGKAAETLVRFAVNSTLGAAGLFDVAKVPAIGLPRRRNGFGDTLGYYGVKPGPFLFLPFTGPTTLRDLIGGTIDGLVLPVAFGKPFNQVTYTAPTGIVRGLDRRVASDAEINSIRAGAADSYTATRELYLKKRQAEIDALHTERRAPAPAPGTTPSGR